MTIVSILLFCILGCKNKNNEFNKILSNRLDSMHSEQNLCQYEISKSDEIFGRDSKESATLRKKADEIDSLHKEEVKEMIEQYGWLGTDKVGPDESTMAFIFVQHSDPVTHKRFLPLLRDAVKNGTAQPCDLALLEDRILVEDCKKQIYGSQMAIDSETNIYYVWPTEDPDNLDKRRMKVGLMPMSDYVRVWDIEWNLKQYKKDLPRLMLKNCVN